MKALLTSQLGFSVIEGYDVNKREFKRLIQKFNQRLRNSDSPAVALFYFSGHGFSGKVHQNNNDTNYLVPLWPQNLPPRDQVSLEYSSISSKRIVTGMRRYNEKGINMMGWMLVVAHPKGLWKTIKKEKVVILAYLSPWFSGSGVRFCFKNCLQSKPSPKPDSSSELSQLLHTCQEHFNANRLTSGRGGTALDCYSEVLKKDRNNAEALAGLNKIEATYVTWIKRALNRDQKKRAKRYMASLRLVNPESLKLRDFEDQMQISPSIQPQIVISQPRQGFSVGEVFQDRLKDGSKGPQMVWIAAGTFKMGSNDGDDNEKPVHRVSITKDFGMGRYEVTFAEYDKFAEATGREKPSDSGWGRGNRPVINVSWHDATAYAKWLSEQTGKKYRLPTEAEWEYVARAGTETKYQCH